MSGTPSKTPLNKKQRNYSDGSPMRIPPTPLLQNLGYGTGIYSITYPILFIIPKLRSECMLFFGGVLYCTNIIVSYLSIMNDIKRGSIQSCTLITIYLFL